MTGKRRKLTDCQVRCSVINNRPMWETALRHWSHDHWQHWVERAPLRHRGERIFCLQLDHLAEFRSASAIDPSQGEIHPVVLPR